MDQVGRAKVKRTVAAVVIRKDGTRTDLGEIAGDIPWWKKVRAWYRITKMNRERAKQERRKHG